MSVYMRRAGDVQGTPDWQLDRAYETETAQKLEEAYAEGEDDFPISRIESEFSMAKDGIGHAVRHLIRAANEADPYGKAGAIDDLVEKLDEDFDDQMRKVLKKLKEGA